MPANDDDLERRLSRNQVLYRRVNEAIERGLWPGEGDQPVRFRCECARMNCNATIEMTVPDYEAVRRNPRHFLLRQGHELAELDFVVARGAEYVVAEKRGSGGAVAERSDPRRP